MGKLDPTKFYVPDSIPARTILGDIRRALLEARGYVIMTSAHRWRPKGADEDAWVRAARDVRGPKAGIFILGDLEPLPHKGWVEVKVLGPHAEAAVALVGACCTEKTILYTEAEKLRAVLDYECIQAVEATWRLAGNIGLRNLITQTLFHAPPSKKRA